MDLDKIRFDKKGIVTLGQRNAGLLKSKGLSRDRVHEKLIIITQKTTINLYGQIKYFPSPFKTISIALKKFDGM